MVGEPAGDSLDARATGPYRARVEEYPPPLRAVTAGGRQLTCPHMTTAWRSRGARVHET